METFKQILDNSFSEVYVFDGKTLHFSHANINACQNLQYSLEELIQLTLLDLNPKLTKETFEEIVQPLREKQESASFFETVHKRKDGSLYPVEVHLQLMHDETPPVFVALADDITKRKKKEEETQLLLNQIKTIAVGTASAIGQDFFKSIVEHLSKALDLNVASFGVLVAERGEIETLALYGNGKILENIVYPVQGTPCEMVLQGKLCLYPDNVQKKFPSDHYLVEMGINSYLGVPLFALDSKTPIGLLSVMDSKPMNQAASTESILHIFAARAEAEIARLKAESKSKAYLLELERSNQELKDFASIASHDLKEPLRKIISLGELVLKSSESMGEKEKDYLRRMQNSSHRMSIFIDDLIMYSRVSLGGHTFQKLDLTDVVNEVLVDLEGALERSGGKVAMENLPTLEGIEISMRQLFQNLISNGLKYSKEGMPPVIKIIGEKAKKDFWKIIVEDNGIGIDEKYLERIFRPFERLHGKAHYEGTGMGLAICRKIVEKHRGEITVESQKGQGTKFIITLPAKQIQPE